MISSFSQSVNLPLEQSVHWWHHSTLMSWSPLANAPFLNVNLFTQIELLLSGIWFVLAISTSEMHVAPQISQTATDCHCTDWLNCYELWVDGYGIGNNRNGNSQLMMFLLDLRKLCCMMRCRTFEKCILLMLVRLKIGIPGIISLHISNKEGKKKTGNLNWIMKSKNYVSVANFSRGIGTCFRKGRGHAVKIYWPPVKLVKICRRGRKTKANTICNSWIILSAVSGSFALFKIRIGLKGMLLVFLCSLKIKAAAIICSNCQFATIEK